MTWLQHLFADTPEAALFLSLALGYAIGKIQFGRFQLGGVGGSLLAAVFVSQVGVQIDDGVKSVMFALFIYAVGYNIGPQFFSSLNKSSLREFALAVFLAAASLVTVVVLARAFHLDKGLAAGLASGALTQSAILGTAGDAIARLPLPPAQIATLQSNLAVACAVTYVFGSLGAIIVCANILPRFMGQDLKIAAEEEEARLRVDGLPTGSGGIPALPPLIGRAYSVTAGAGRTVADIERAADESVTVEWVVRDDKIMDLTPGLVLQPDDHVAVIGRREEVFVAQKRIGPEAASVGGPPLVLRAREAVFARKNMNRATVAEVKERLEPQMRHGVYIESITRMGRPIPVLPGTEIMNGDVITYYGADGDTARAAKVTGYPLASDNKTDFVLLGIGIVFGLVIGSFVAHIGGFSLTLGPGGGALLSGLIFGWARGKRPMIGESAPAARKLLQDFGLAAFVAVVGLNSGRQALGTIGERGLTIIVLGLIVTFLPLLLTMLFGRFVLGYRNAAIFAGALAGSRSANPAFGVVLDRAGSSVPTVAFAITYALSNVLLTLLGPLIVALV